MTDQSTENESTSSTATTTRPAPSPSKPGRLPLWKVLLHNDDVNTGEYVIETIVMLTTLNELDALQRMHEADREGVSLLLITHKERAELYQEQFASRNLTVTIEADE